MTEPSAHAPSVASPLRFWFQTPLWMRILGGLALGAIAGALLGENAGAIRWIGDLFINAIKMLVAPLVLASLVAGVTALDKPSEMGRLGGKAFALYLATTGVAISFGLIVANLFGPGRGVTLAGTETAPEQGSFSLVQRIIDIVPTNPFQALAEGKALQIIFFALLLGAAIVALGEPAKPVKRFFESFAEVMYKITEYIMEFAPFGVFALIASVVGTQGAAILSDLAVLGAAAYAAMLLHAFITYGAMIRFVAGLPIRRFIYGIADALAVAYSTSTSSGTLPVTIRCARENLGVDNTTASFVLPLGATINMDGTALYQGVICVFAAQIAGVDLTLAQYGTIIVTASLVSIGTAGIPSASLVLSTITLSSVGLPLEVIAIVAGVDRLIDMARTVTNVTGDSMVATLVAKSEGTLDEAVFRAPSRA